MERTKGAVGVDAPTVTTALLAAQATAGVEGFRQRDVRFFAELFSNWLEATTGERTATLHNTQVLRCMGDLSRVRWAKRCGRTPPRWTLTGEGLVELLRRLVDRRDLRRLDEFFLVYHFLDAYGGQLRALVQQGGAMASPLLAVDLDALLSPARLIARERERVARERARLRVWAQEARTTSQLARTRLEEGAALADIVAEVELRHPYALNSQRPLSELLGALPERWRREELVEASVRRAHGLFDSQEALLQAYDGILERLLCGNAGFKQGPPAR